MRIALDFTPSAGSIGHGIGVYARALAGALAGVSAPDVQFDLSCESRRWYARFHGAPELDGRFSWRRLWPVPVRLGWARRVDLYHALEPRLPRARFPREIVTFHDMYPFYPQLWSSGTPDVVRYHAKRLRRYPEIVARAHAIICVSRHTADDLARLAPGAEHKTLVIPHGTDAGEPGRMPRERDLPAAVREASRGRYFVHVGSMWRIRNLPTTVRAFAAVARSHPDVRLVMVGEPGEDTGPVRDLVSRLGLERSVLLLGKLGDPEKLHLVARATGLLMFHLYAGFGLPLLEAMALGVPFLASDRGALPETGGDAGLYAAPDDEEGMAALMERLLSDDELRRTLGERGRERSRRYSWRAAAEATYSVYRTILGAP